MLYRILFGLLKNLVSIFFNTLNLLLAGNLPPFVCVGAIVEENGRFLVIEHVDGTLGFPGGFMRWRERPAQTALREMKEETGLAIRLNGVVGHYSLISRNFAHMSTVTIIYQAEVVGGELRSSVEGKACWRNEEELRAHPAARPGFIRILDEYLRMPARSAPTVVSENELDTRAATRAPTPHHTTPAPTDLTPPYLE